MKKRSYDSINKTNAKMKQRGHKRQHLPSQSWKSDNYVGSNSEKLILLSLYWKKYM
jgi:hypothetical protein